MMSCGIEAQFVSYRNKSSAVRVVLKMEEILTEIVPSEDLKKFEKIYHDQQFRNAVTPIAQFEYAYCLVRSKYSADIKKGIILLEDLYKSDEDNQRDYIYYLALGNARLKNYKEALNFIRSFLQVEPTNQQLLALEAIVKKKMEKEGLKGIAITSGAVLAVGAVVGVVLAATRSK